MRIQPMQQEPLKFGWNIGIDSVEADLELVEGRVEWGLSHRSSDVSRVATIKAGRRWWDTSLFAVMDLLTRINRQVWKSDPPAADINIPVEIRGSRHTLFAESNSDRFEFGIRDGRRKFIVGSASFDYANSRVELRLIDGRKSYGVGVALLLKGLADCSSLIDNLSTFQQDVEWSEHFDEHVEQFSGRWVSPFDEISLRSDGKLTCSEGPRLETGLWELRQAPQRPGRAAVAVIKLDSRPDIQVASLSADGARLELLKQSGQSIDYTRRDSGLTSGVSGWWLPA